MFIVALFTIAKTCPSTDEWIRKMWYMHAMEYYSALKRKKILQYATVWVDLTDTMLSEISQSQMDKSCVILLL